MNVVQRIGIVQHVSCLFVCQSFVFIINKTYIYLIFHHFTIFKIHFFRRSSFQLRFVCAAILFLVVILTVFLHFYNIFMRVRWWISLHLLFRIYTQCKFFWLVEKIQWHFIVVVIFVFLSFSLLASVSLFHMTHICHCHFKKFFNLHQIDWELSEKPNDDFFSFGFCMEFSFSSQHQGRCSACNSAKPYNKCKQLIYSVGLCRK